MFKIIKPSCLHNLSVIYTINNINSQYTNRNRLEYFIEISNNKYHFQPKNLELITKLWRFSRNIRYLILGFLAKKKQKSFQIRNTTDLFLNDLHNSNEVIKHIDFPNKSIYLFSFEDITRTWLSAINFHNFEIAQPLDLKNPYNNSKLTFLEFYNIYRQYEVISYIKRRQIPILIRLLRQNLLNHKKLLIKHSYLINYNACYNYVCGLNDELFRAIFLEFYNSLLPDEKPCPLCFKLEKLNDYRDVFNRVITLFLLEENNIVNEDLIKKWKKVLVRSNIYNSNNHKMEFHFNKKSKKTGKMIGKSKISRKKPISLNPIHLNPPTLEVQVVDNPILPVHQAIIDNLIETIIATIEIPE